MVHIFAKNLFCSNIFDTGEGEGLYCDVKRFSRVEQKINVLTTYYDLTFIYLHLRSSIRVENLSVLVNTVSSVPRTVLSTQLTLSEDSLNKCVNE